MKKEINCIICGKKFLSTGRIITCSHECSVTYNNNRYQLKPGRMDAVKKYEHDRYHNMTAEQKRAFFDQTNENRRKRKTIKSNN